MQSHWPQYTILFLIVMGLGISLARHGEPKLERESFWTSLFAYAITVWLLLQGGFFNALLK